MRKGMTAITCLAFVLSMMNSRPVLADTVMTFEEFLGNDTAPVSTFYSGITFRSGYSGSDWVARDATTGSYNISSWPSGQAWGSGEYWIYGNVGATTALDYSGNDGIIAFDSKDATFVELGYSSGSDLYLLAYDSMGNMIAQDSGPANRRYIEGNGFGPGTLRVDAPAGTYISYVDVHDTGNYWVVDNIRTDATGIVIHPIPGPSAIVLGGLGMSLVSWFRRRKTVA